ncbi:MAG: hypothetical protein V1708_02585 [Candidatus Micrarchaeota archaeon]
MGLSEKVPQNPQQPVPSRVPAPAIEAPEEEELEEPEEGDAVGMLRYNAEKLWVHWRGPIRRNFVKGVFVLALLAVAFWYFFARPQPGTVILSVVRVDSDGAGVPSLITATYEGGTTAAEGLITDETGVVRIPLAAGKGFSVRVAPVSAKLRAITSSQSALSSREQRGVEIQVGAKTGLKFVSDPVSVSLGAKCSRTISVTVANEGQAQEAAELVPDEGLSGFLRSTGLGEPIEPGDAVAIPVKLTAGGEEGQASGKIRIKGTTVSLPVSIASGNSPSKLEVGFDKPEAKDFTGPAGAEIVKKSNVMVKNAAAPDSVALTDISVAVYGDFIPWHSLDLAKIDQANAEEGIPPGGQELFQFTIRVPADTPPGPYIGRLEVSSSCGSVSIPLNAQIG